MPNLFEKELGIPLPKCCNTGACCKGASPSTPYHKLMARAADGDEFAQGFFSIMVPYLKREEAEKVVPGVVERTLLAAQKQPEEFQTDADVVFYNCRYQTPDNKCGVWEDRPQFCRDYPDTPFVVMAPGCAFEPWAAACKEKYSAMKAEVEQLKALKEELAALKKFQETGISENGAPPPDLSQLALSGDAGLPKGGFGVDNLLENSGGQTLEKIFCENSPYGDEDTKIDAGYGVPDNTTVNLSLVLSLTGLYLSTPLGAMYFLR